MKTVILARVSTEEQKEAGNSLPAQQERLRQYVKRKTELVLIKEFIFDESAYKEHRKEFDKIIDFILEQKEVVALCCDKVDRLSRDFLVGLPALEKLRREGKIELHFPSDNLILHQDSPATDLFHFNIAVSLAQYYSNSISDNTRRAFEHKRRNGEWCGQPRIGYKNVTNEDGKKDIVLDPERAHLIQKLFELYATGNHSIQTIWLKLTKMGLRSRDNNKLSRSNIEYILKDPFYYGMAKSNKYGLYEHRYERLISRELFEKCQDIRKGRKKMPSKMVSSDYIFKGLLKCKNCGCMMSPEIHRKKSGLVFIYYSCTNSRGICQREYVPEKALLKPVYDVFRAFEGIPKEVQERLLVELRKLNESEADYHHKEISRINVEYEKVQNRINKLLDMHLDGRITKDDYDKKLEELKDKQYKLTIELEEHTKADHQYHIHVANILNICKRIKTLFESSDPLEKRAILNYLLQNPTVSAKKLEFTLRKPYNLILQLSGTPNWLRGLDSNQRPSA